MIELPARLLLTSIAAATAAGYACSTSGVFVVRMNLSAIGFTMSHAAFAGAAFALWVGIDPLWGAVLFAIVTSVVLGPLSERARLKAEVTLGFLFSLLMALGFVFLNLVPGEAASAVALRIIWGSILSVDVNDVLYLAVLSVGILTFTVGFHKEILSVLFDRKMAEASGIDTRMFYYSILLVTGLSVAFSLKLVGGLLVYALIINPSSTAYQFLDDMKKIIVASPIIGIATSLCGFIFSLQFDLPVGSSIIIVSALVLAFSIAISPRRRKSGLRMMPAAAKPSH